MRFNLRQLVRPPRRWSVFTATKRQNARVTPNLDIFLNGQTLHDCVSYDCARGIAEVYKRDERDMFVVSSDRDHLLTKIVTGDIRVEWRS